HPAAEGRGWYGGRARARRLESMARRSVAHRRRLRRQHVDCGDARPDRGAAGGDRAVCDRPGPHPYIRGRRHLHSPCGGVLTMATLQGRDLIVGIDAGTSLIKTVAFTRDGQQLGEFALPNSYSVSAGGQVEQEMSRTWTDTVAAIRGLASVVPDL